MEQIFVSNGTTQLVLVPDNDTDRMLMERLLANGPVVIERIRHPHSILGHSVMDALIIRPSSVPSKYDRSKKEAVPSVSADEVHLEVAG